MRWSPKNVRIVILRDAILPVVSVGILLVLVAFSAWLLFSLARDVRTLFREETPAMIRSAFDLEVIKRLEKSFPSLFQEGEIGR